MSNPKFDPQHHAHTYREHKVRFRHVLVTYYFQKEIELFQDLPYFLLRQGLTQPSKFSKNFMEQIGHWASTDKAMNCSKVEGHIN